jgi:L-ascorbate metabolism protein UlaG (beta-lactamase superfamily)
MKLLPILTICIAFTFQPVFAQLSNTPDSYTTSAGELTVHPINHGTVAFTFDEMTIFVDPFGGAELFTAFEAPDMIFITDIHGDHFNPNTLNGLQTENTTFVVPQAVADRMETPMGKEMVIISNGETTTTRGLSVTAVPMYNLPDDESSRHKKGRGNGYVISFGDKDIYLSGDTEDIPEMRALENIDIAFVCMNLPYTMDIYQAASAVIDFEPEMMYPYHHRGQDIKKFKQLIELAEIDTEIILKDWYSN